MTRRVAAKPGFTLIELLVVIAIIVLLIGILVPALNAARDQAKKASSAARIKALGDGAEMFHKELDKYPRSAGTNPF
ncbi:MAG: prepilin-type N-terminal cleavage/methylation domain-containing protein, partial [Planctomycetes bacterium]|nr:prepilin-type N-terminal cleavage/methylation domain-containing protein [Planctomycetota bacterium]